MEDDDSDWDFYPRLMFKKLGLVILASAAFADVTVRLFETDASTSVPVDSYLRNKYVES